MGTHCYGITLITSHETWLVHTSVYQFTMPNAKKNFSKRDPMSFRNDRHPARQMLILFRRIKNALVLHCPPSVTTLIFTGCPISIQVQLDTLLLRWETIISFEHSSEIRGLRSTKCSSETLQNLLYFMYRGSSHSVQDCPNFF